MPTKLAAFFSILFLWSMPSKGMAALQLPERPQSHVNDYAQVLTEAAIDGLEKRFDQFERRTGHQAAVAIFPTLEGEPIEDVATKLFEKWRLGTKKENDGVLLVLAMKEHGIRIETGYGMEGKLPDALSGRIIREDMKPFLKQNQVATAILAFEKRLEDIFIDGKTPAPPSEQTHNKAMLFLLIIFILVILFSIPRRQSRILGSRGAFWGGWWSGGGWGGGGWGSGSSGGGSGWGGGGGGLSGGGGASDSW